MVMLSHFIYSKRNNFIFTYIPKVACTNWKCILRYLDGHADYLNTQIAHDRVRSGLAYLSTLQDGEVLLREPTIPKFTCVRNPYTRILSAYLNKVKPFALDNATSERDPYFYMIFQKIDAFRKSEFSDTQFVSFGCFLKWIEASGDPLTRNEHWIPQTEILGTGEVFFDYIGRFENIQDDAPKLLELMKCDIPFPSQQTVKFPPTHASDLIKTYYEVDDYRTVNRIYDSDFEYLVYDSKSI